MKDIADIKIGFIGFGNMAQAMAKGLVNFGGFDGKKIYACAGRYEKLLDNAKRIGVNGMKNAAEVAENSDFVVLAVKPRQMQAAISSALDLLNGKAVISVAAGFDFDECEKILKPNTRHISTIPNTPISVGEGIIVCEKRHSLTEEEYRAFAEIFGKTAMIETVETAQLSIAGTISGSAPAFTAMYLEALGDAGVKHGLPREAAYRMAAKMLRGTGGLFLRNGGHPGTLKDAVCSPGGTTIRGVGALEKCGFRGAVIGAVDATENG